jgi:hypothetical protein
MAGSKKVLVGTVHLAPDENSPEGVVYYDGDTPSDEHAKLITNPNAWRVETGDEEDDLYVNADEQMREFLRQAKALGIEPGKGLPRNPSKELVARAISLHNAGANVDVAEEQARLDGRTKEGRAAKASGSVAGS